jgi:hypothetical protein
MTRLCVLLPALAIIAGTHVSVLPGWVLPVPAVLLATAVLGCATAGIALFAYRRR